MKKLEGTIQCPNCKRGIKIRVEEMVPGRSKKCPNCQTSIKFTGDDGRKAQEALDDLERTIKKMKDIKIDIKL